MQEHFHIAGLFYEKEDHKFREFLDIKHIKSSKTDPDFMIIMMNPGSSKPIDGIDNNNEISEAKPDNTQDQIMRIMLNFGYEYARVLNLSDLREGKSKNFYPMILQFEQKKIDHSIFCENRVQDFYNLFIYGVPLLYAWGVSHELKELAQQAMKRIGDVPFIGLQKEGIEWGYYHPLPPSTNKQKLWVENILTVIKDNKVIAEEAIK